MYSFSIRQFISEYIGDLFFGKVLECKKINKAQMVDFPTKPFQKMPKKQSRKGGSLEVP